MCGLFVICSQDSPIKKDKAIESLRLLEHRGPDYQSFNIFNEDKLFIGHRLLRIRSNLEESIQPITSKGGRYTISYNGEIYNSCNLSRKYLLDEKFHLIINPDIIIEDENLITKLVNYLNQNDDTAMIQPLIIGYPDKAIQFLCKRNPTFIIQILRGFFNNFTNKLKFLRNYNFWYEMRDLAYKKDIVESTYLSGAFMLCRTAILNKINWFDERFFMYLEDADLTRRLSKFGKCIHHPLFTVRHVWARGSHKSIFLKLIAIVSYFKYSQKWGLKIF